MFSDRIRIVLVEPSHPGNIGGVARAMKNMGLSRLVLVSPERFPADEATARASGADDVLAAAEIVDSLEDALQGCTHVCGATARSRSIDWPTLDPRQYVQQVFAESDEAEFAVVFGRERSGLTNAELDRCHVRVAIPVDEGFPSLNLACAVQVLAYEIKYAETALNTDSSLPAPLADQQPVGAEEMERFYEHLETVLIELEFLNPEFPKKLMRRLKRLYNRAAPIPNEMNILRGILTAVQDQSRRYNKT